MKPKNLFLCVGIPGSGKSTWVKNNSEKLNAKVVSRDNIRFSLLNKNDGYFDKETEVFNLFIKEIQKHLDNNENVIADATHLNQASRNKVLNKLNLNGVDITPIHFDTSLNLALERNENREGLAKVPRGAIRRMFFQLEAPNYNETFKYKSIIRVKGDTNDLFHI